MFRPKYRSARYSLPVSLPSFAGESLRIAFLSDLHGCCRPSEQQSILQLLAEQEPDLLLCGGDLINGSPHFDMRPLFGFLQTLSSRVPVYTCLGNHEQKMRWAPDSFGRMESEFLQGMQQAGVLILEDTSVLLRIRGIPVRIGGILLGKEHYGHFLLPPYPAEELHARRLFPEEEAVRILLAHHPKVIPAAIEAGIDLTLCGHYHGGIMRFNEHKGLISPELRLFPQNAAGHFHIKKKHGIISSGCGEHTLPIRIHNPREIVEITILIS